MDVSDPLLIEAGATLRGEVRFYDDEDNEITGIEEDHHTVLAFTPADLATTAAVAGENFQKDITARPTPGTGSYTVGYGHDVEADELTFGPFEVMVVVTGSAAGQGR